MLAVCRSRQVGAKACLVNIDGGGSPDLRWLTSTAQQPHPPSPHPILICSRSDSQASVVHLSATSDFACLSHIKSSVLGKVGAQGQAWIYVEHMLLAIDGEHEELVTTQR